MRRSFLALCAAALVTGCAVSGEVTNEDRVNRTMTTGSNIPKKGGVGSPEVSVVSPEELRKYQEGPQLPKPVPGKSGF